MVEFKVGDKVIPRIDGEDGGVATVVGVWKEYLWLDEGNVAPSTVEALNCRPPGVPAKNYGENK
jgi:hypothetical protein